MRDDIKKIIEHTRATMAFEGLETDKEVEDLYINYLEGKISYSEMMDEILKGVEKIKQRSDARFVEDKKKSAAIE